MRTALAAAAVVGLEFEPAVIQSAVGLAEDELCSALEEALQARLIVEVPGSLRSRFSHSPVRATLYDELKGEQEIQDQLIFAYSQRRETAAVDKLMDIARREQNRELRKKAIFWLGQSKDPRVPKFLLEILNQQ